MPSGFVYVAVGGLILPFPGPPLSLRSFRRFVFMLCLTKTCANLDNDFIISELSLRSFRRFVLMLCLTKTCANLDNEIMNDFIIS